MATTAASEPVNDLPTTSPAPDSAKKKSKSGTSTLINPAQYQAIRLVSFMTEDTKHEITPTDFITEALARHLAYYQSKRIIEFPPKMLLDLTSLSQTKTRSEE